MHRKGTSQHVLVLNPIHGVQEASLMSYCVAEYEVQSVHVTWSELTLCNITDAARSSHARIILDSSWI